MTADETMVAVQIAKRACHLKPEVLKLRERNLRRRSISGTTQLQSLSMLIRSVGLARRSFLHCTVKIEIRIAANGGKDLSHLLKPHGN